MPSPSLPAAVLWDMDGTLVDTEPLWIAAETELVESFGGRWTHDDGLQLVGSPLPVSAEVLQGRGVELSVDAIIARLAAGVIRGQVAGPPWQPGAYRLLVVLRDLGVPQALVTSSYRDLTVPLVTAIDVFTAVVSGDEVAHAKPHPEPYLTAARRLGVDPAACVVVEDSRPGIASALASGAHVLAVQTLAGVLDDHPRLSRTDSLTRVGPAELARIAAGAVLELSVDRFG